MEIDLKSPTMIVVGGPGCGKTTRLKAEIIKLVESGVPLHNIGFASFSKAAVSEIRNRVCTQFAVDAEAALPWFRTLHSIGYATLQLQRNEVFSTGHLKDFAEWIGVKIDATYDPELDMIVPGKSEGASLLFHENLARVKCVSYEDHYDTIEARGIFTLPVFLQFCEALKVFKNEHKLYDFTDMLSSIVAPIPQITHWFFDEFQDSNFLQLKAIQALCNSPKIQHIYVAGDDDQAIYSYANGVSGAHLLQALKGTRIILAKTHRLPQNIYDFSQKIITQVDSRLAKLIVAASPGGLVDFHTHLKHVDFDIKNKTYFVLVRNNYHLRAVSKELKIKALPFLIKKSKHSIEQIEIQAIGTWNRLVKGDNTLGSAIKNLYYLLMPNLVKRGFKSLSGFDINKNYTYDDLVKSWGLLAKTTDSWKTVLNIAAHQVSYYEQVQQDYGDAALMDTPKIEINSIHQSKGREADCVIVMSDMSTQSYKTYQKDPDAERRVFYVAATRAKKELHIINPQTRKFFKWPKISQT